MEFYESAFYEIWGYKGYTKGNHDVHGLESFENLRLQGLHISKSGILSQEDFENLWLQGLHKKERQFTKFGMI